MPVAVRTVKEFHRLHWAARFAHHRPAELGGRLSAYSIGLVVGTRPEAIKLAPVAEALARAGMRPHLFLTGQHPLLEPADHGLAGFRATPLGLKGLADPIAHAEKVAARLERLWRGEAPDLVLVQGDTSSALGGARAAAARGLPLGHVEAGLRTHDERLPWPEEGFRVEIDRLADLLFAPTEGNAANLAAERCRGAVHVTGNSGIDALLATAPRLDRRRPSGSGPLRLLVTCHRRESWGAGFIALAAALRTLGESGSARTTVLLHPNPRVAGAVLALLGDAPRVRLRAPLDYQAMIRAMLRADLLLSDSGGLQEEAPALGVPLLVLRALTERPEAIASGNALLVGTDTARIVETVTDLHEDRSALALMARPALPFGDGRSAPRIAALLRDWLERRDPRAAPARARLT